MSKSNIALALIAGAVIGGIVIIALKAEGALHAAAGADDEQEDKKNTRTKEIAKQFSERISSDLHAAEMKIKSGVKKDSDFSKPHGEFGVFL